MLIPYDVKQLNNKPNRVMPFTHVYMPIYLLWYTITCTFHNRQYTCHNTCTNALLSIVLYEIEFLTHHVACKKELKPVDKHPQSHVWFFFKDVDYPTKIYKDSIQPYHGSRVFRFWRKVSIIPIIFRVLSNLPLVVWGITLHTYIHTVKKYSLSSQRNVTSRQLGMNMFLMFIGFKESSWQSYAFLSTPKLFKMCDFQCENDVLLERDGY